MDAIEDWETHAERMKEVTNGDFTAAFRGKHFRLNTTTVEGFRALQSCLCESSLPFHTFHMKPDWDLKVVISGLPEVTPESLLDALIVGERFSVRDAVRMHAHWGPTRSWLITLLPDSQRDPRGHQEGCGDLPLFCVKVAVSRYRRLAGRPQCYRCQRFGHGSDNSGRPLRCVRCGDPHMPRSCRLPDGQKCRCCNCGGDHNLNYRGCPTFKAAKQAFRASKSGRDQPRSRRCLPPGSRRSPSHWWRRNAVREMTLPAPTRTPLSNGGGGGSPKTPPTGAPVPQDFRPPRMCPRRQGRGQHQGRGSTGLQSRLIHNRRPKRTPHQQTRQWPALPQQPEERKPITSSPRSSGS